jgi:glycerol kinase
VGIWQTLDEIERLPRPRELFEPRISALDRATLYSGWQTAVARAILGTKR